MKHLLLALCVILMASTCFAVPVKSGVLSEDRVVNLPNDQGKWYLSVVGNARNAQYQTIMKWFSQDIPLRQLKAQVHFCPIESSSAIYKARYAPNVKGLPTVRLQNSQGTVIYEAAGKNLPFTPQGLYGAFAGNVSKAEGRPIRPWRRNNARPFPCPSPRPSPQPAPDPDFDLDPEPQPIDDGGQPDFEDVPVPDQSNLPPLWLMLVTFVVSAGAGLAVEWKDTYTKK